MDARDPLSLVTRWTLGLMISHTAFAEPVVPCAPRQAAQSMTKSSLGFVTNWTLGQMTSHTRSRFSNISRVRRSASWGVLWLAAFCGGVFACAASAAPANTGSSGPVLAQAKRAIAGNSGDDVSDALRRLAIALPRLSGAQAAQARALLARPTDSRNAGWQKYTVAEHKPFCTIHFCIHWVDSTSDAPNLTDLNVNGIPDFVDGTAIFAEIAYAVENGTLKWAHAKPDGKRGGSKKVDIYLAQLAGKGYDGFQGYDPGQRGRSRHGYVVMDNDFLGYGITPIIEQGIVVAHEYLHLLQARYDSFQDSWAIESGAVWMQDQVFDGANTYVGYLPAWVKQTAVPITKDRQSKIYGSVVFNMWLSARFGRDVMKDIWSGARRSRPGGYAPNAYGAGIRRQGGKSFQRAFGNFAADTAEWRINGKFPEGRQYPDVKRAGGLKAGKRMSLRLDHTAYKLIEVRRKQGRAKNLQMKVKVGGGADAAIALVGRGKAGGTKTSIRYIKNGGFAKVSLPLPGQFSRITAVLVNTDIGQRGYRSKARDWRYTHNHIPFKISLR